MSNIPSINLVSRRGRLPTAKTGRKRLFMRGFAVSVKSFSSDPSAKDMPRNRPKFRRTFRRRKNLLRT